MSAKERERGRKDSGGANDYVSLGAGGAVKAATDGEQALARWMAPECLRDAEYTHKSDVWAMGVVIYEVGSLLDYSANAAGHSRYPFVSRSRRLRGCHTGR